jgi:hypothetical protein
MISIKEMGMYNIPKVTRGFSIATNIEKKKEWMCNFVDEELILNLDEETTELLFEKTKDIVEKKIRDLIKEHTGQVAIEEGTKVKTLRDFGNHEKGTEGVVKICERFEEDTFGQGWYIYKVGLPSEDKPMVLYRHEFEVVE